MPWKHFPLAAGTLLALVLTGCGGDTGKALDFPDPGSLPTPGVLTGNTHLTILQTTDIHDHALGVGPLAGGLLLPATSFQGINNPAVYGGFLGTSGGYARISAYVANVRAAADANHPVVLIDSGDWSTGTYYDLALTQFPLPLVNLAIQKYDCVALGDHEFDWTTAGLAQVLATPSSQGSINSGFNFNFNVPIVATNFTPNEDLAGFYGPAAMIRPTYVEKLATGLKVGYIGLMGADARGNVANAAGFGGFSDYAANGYAALQATVDGLRTTQGCHVVIALSHAGTDPSGNTGEDINLAQAVSGIDVIASGHTHNAVPAPVAVAGPNGWTTQVISPGALGTSVFRLDLAYDFAARKTTVVAPGSDPEVPAGPYNQPMTDDNLKVFERYVWAKTNHTSAVSNPANTPTVNGLPFYADASYLAITGLVDPMLNGGLAPILSAIPGFDPGHPESGLFQALGAPMQDMAGNQYDALPTPNGLGDFLADADLFTANGLNAQSGGYATDTQDPNPFFAAVIPNASIRDSLAGGRAISFANLYDLTPIGITPDTSQAVPPGYPLVSVYLDQASLRSLAAAQLMAQTPGLLGQAGLAPFVPPANYPHISGITWTLNGGGKIYFKAVTALVALEVATAKAMGGSALAGTALGDLNALAGGDPTALLTDAGVIPGAGVINPYAAAMVQLNDDAMPADPTENLTALGAVAIAANTSTEALTAYLAGAAAGDVQNVAFFAPGTDPSCVGATTLFSDAMPGANVRVAGNFFTVLMLQQIGASLGLPMNMFADAAGSTPYTASNGQDLAMASRLNATPGAALTELKEWMASLTYLTTPVAGGGHFDSGMITGEYASANTVQAFPVAGADAVNLRSAYPKAAILALQGVAGGLLAAD